MDRSPVYVGTANTFQRASETPRRAFFLGPAMPDERKLPREHQELADRGARYQGKFAVAGEWVTCERGHRICRVAKDIEPGALHDDAFFADWQQEAPKHGTDPRPCARCGGKWFRGTIRIPLELPGAELEVPMGLHFEEGGWR